MTNPLDSAINPYTKAGFSQVESRISRLQQEYLHPADKDHDKLKKAAQDFEAVFINQLLEAMDKTVDRSGLLSGGNAEQMFRGMMNQEVSKQMATRVGGSGFGLAEAVYQQLSGNLKPTSSGGPGLNTPAIPGHFTLEREG